MQAAEQAGFTASTARVAWGRVAWSLKITETYNLSDGFNVFVFDK